MDTFTKPVKWEDIFVSHDCILYTLLNGFKNDRQTSPFWSFIEKSFNLKVHHMQRLRFSFGSFWEVRNRHLWTPRVFADPRLLVSWSWNTWKTLCFLFSFIFARVALLTELYKYSPVYEWVWCSIKLGILLPRRTVNCATETRDTLVNAETWAFELWKIIWFGTNIHDNFSVYFQSTLILIFIKPEFRLLWRNFDIKLFLLYLHLISKVGHGLCYTVCIYCIYEWSAKLQKKLGNNILQVKLHV